MHFHLPKPIHGWREFIGEIAIVVIGVLIAIGAEEAVQTRHWKHLVDETQESLNAQLLDSKFSSLMRIKYSECFERQLDALDKLIDLPNFPSDQYHTTGLFNTWDTSAWDAAIASGAVAHMRPELRQSYAGIFSLTSKTGALDQQAFAARQGLLTLRYHTKLNDTSRDRLAEAIARSRSYDWIITLSSKEWLEASKRLNIGNLSAEEREELAKPVACTLPGATPDNRN